MGFGFSWSTFVVEIVNFLILVWLLTRFFYQPVLRTIASREQRIKDELSHAQDAQTEAAELTKRYETRLADWEQEKAGLRERFDAELATLRATRESELQDVLERERRQAAVAAAIKERDEQRRLWQQSARDASRFAARLLSRLATPSLERRLIEVTSEDLMSLPSDKRATLANAANGKADAVITSRYALDETERSALAAALETCLGKKPSLAFKCDDNLVAGLRIEVGTAIIDANVGAELAWFAQTESAQAESNVAG